MNTQIIYEFPLNERIRVFMRLEQLFLQLDHFMAGESVFDKRAAISVLLDILLIFGRGDLKSELLKELDRHIKLLNQLSVEQTTTEVTALLEQLGAVSRNLYNTNGRIGSGVMESDLFQSIAQRNAIPGGSCSFDLPAYHFWLEHNLGLRSADLDSWIQPFSDVRTALALILNNIRSNGLESSELAQAGFFQLALDKNQTAQLLRVGIAQEIPYFAEISGGKHRFSIRFMKPSQDENRPSQSTESVVFNLTRCLF